MFNMPETINPNARKQDLNRDWAFMPGMYSAESAANARTVQLPHDYLIETDTRPEAMSGPATGYYDAFPANYTKHVVIPAEWKGDPVILRFDGAMQNATVEVNGSYVSMQHYGYAPFDADISPYLYWGEKNRITVTTHPGTQPNSRWYAGAGLYRQVWLYHKPLIHIAQDGIFTVTERLEWEQGMAVEAFLRTGITVRNGTSEDRLVQVEIRIAPEDKPDTGVTASALVQVKANAETTVLLRSVVDHPQLWDAEHPCLYTVHAEIRDQGVFGVRQEEESASGIRDTDTVRFGIRTIETDARHGLRINGIPVKLRGGCIHHDNGILGAESFRDSEVRKIRKMKEIGYNAVRTSHNPPSTVLLDVCDELGMYVLDEAFDGWRIGKNPGDCNQYFDTDWEKDVEAFVRRDRNHASVILWSTGNEVMERGGLGDGYTLSEKLARKVQSLDTSRPVTHALCSFWSGLDDRAMDAFRKQIAAAMSGDGMTLQNLQADPEDLTWEKRTEPMVNALDVVGYNYMDGCYERDAKLYPNRVIVGTESYPSQMHEVWELTEKCPHVIGDFTWTAVDYIGEAGIGKVIFTDPEDPRVRMGSMAAMNTKAEWPWRLAWDADIDLCGNLTPQGVMRKILWGGSETRIFVQDPSCRDRTELISPWGWETVSASWNWPGAEGREIRVVVYSATEEVALSLNGETVAKKPTEKHRAEFVLRYAPGTLRAAGFRDGAVLSEDELETAGKATEIHLIREQTVLKNDGMSLLYVPVEIRDACGRLVPDADLQLHAEVTGAGTLAGFGSADPRARDNYSTGDFATWRGKALAIIRAETEAGSATLTIRGGNMEAAIQIQIGGEDNVPHT